MTLFELIAALKELESRHLDPERSHIEADALLLRYINDGRVTVLHEKLALWFA